jgi:TonB family protein
MIGVRHSACAMLCAFGFVLLAQDSFSPARYRTGAVPAVPALVVGGGQVILELAIDRDGRVTVVTPLRTTPPFTNLLTDAVRDWHFSPAREDVRQNSTRADELQTSVESKVLVAAVYRPPAMNAPTLGELPKNIASPSTDVAFPLTIAAPLFPPSARASGVVLLETRVNRDGSVGESTVVRSAPPFDDAARAALRKWKFRPAHVRGVPVSTFVYLLFGFPVPVAPAFSLLDRVPEVAEILWQLNSDFSHIASRQPHAHRLEDRAGNAFGFLWAHDQMIADAAQELVAVEDLRRRSPVPGARAYQFADVGRQGLHQLARLVAANPQ